MKWREEVIGDARLILGDCLEVMPTLGTVDVTISDPPYGIPHNFTAQGSGKWGVRTLSFSWDGPAVTRGVIRAAEESADLSRAAFWFCGLHQASGIADALLVRGMTPKPAAWVKKCPPPAMSGNWWPSGFEIAVYAYRPGAYFGDGDTKRSNVFVADSYRYGQPGKVDHPTQKPLALIERIVSAMTTCGDVVLDCYAGSGTTGVACANLRRKFIGIEIEPAYFDIARKRIEAAYRQRDLFRDEPQAPKPVQQSLLGDAA